MIKYGNRGMNLESDINITNAYYIEENIALIYKKPTPIQVTKVKYKQGKIDEGYFKTPSTTDYNGIYKGYYIDFEAKETKNKTSFPLSSIHKHQIEHIKKVIEHKGIGFLIIRFTTLNKTFLYKGEDFIDFIKNKDRKSIPIQEFIDKAYEIELKFKPRLDYIKIINKVYLGGK